MFRRIIVILLIVLCLFSVSCEIPCGEDPELRERAQSLGLDETGREKISYNGVIYRESRIFCIAYGRSEEEEILSWSPLLIPMAIPQRFIFGLPEPHPLYIYRGRPESRYIRVHLSEEYDPASDEFVLEDGALSVIWSDVLTGESLPVIPGKSVFYRLPSIPDIGYACILNFHSATCPRILARMQLFRINRTWYAHFDPEVDEGRVYALTDSFAALLAEHGYIDSIDWPEPEA